VTTGWREKNGERKGREEDRKGLKEDLVKNNKRRRTKTELAQRLPRNMWKVETVSMIKMRGGES